MNNSTAKAKPKMTVKNGVVYGDALSAQEKKRIVMQKKKDRKAKKVRKSAQQTIPYVEMCRDGICKVNSRLYTKSIAFEDSFRLSAFRPYFQELCRLHQPVQMHRHRQEPVLWKPELLQIHYMVPLKIPL